VGAIIRARKPGPPATPELADGRSLRPELSPQTIG
jgi:hypothetical protein